MTTFAYVFPGQGSQSVGMGKALAETSPAAVAIFATADKALGEPISTLAFDGPQDNLNRTENAQPALLATSIAYLAAVHERASRSGMTLPNPMFYAGHSMGQYSAMVASSALSLPDGIRLVRERGVQMQASGSGRDGAMAAILGLTDDALPELVAQASTYGVFAVANRNSPGQVVVSGERAAIDAATELAKSLGAKRAIVLPVSVAAHSPLMEEAAEAMRRVLAGVAFREPTAALLANADARPILDGAGARAELIDHLTAGVDWVLAVETMIADGVDTFIEVGPGKVLTNLIKRIAPAVTAIALDEVLAGEGLDLPILVPTGPGASDQPRDATPT
ncbi:MAG TPA: ACP S-malonyltransferase [Candidatus Limnocylindria bacterium]|nr:ACP S-malonyltransferase [Candidatus Limnocylindria bacterium]